jgi:hypothetical protein
VTDAEWLASTDPFPMFPHLGDRASARKLRLYGCAWGRSAWDRLPDPRSRQAVLTAERFADGLASPADLLAAFTAAQQAWSEIPEVRGYRRVRGNKALNGARTAKWAAGRARDVASPEWGVRVAWRFGLGEKAAVKLVLANYLRGIFGVPGRPVAIEPAWLAWQGGTIRRMAEAIYEDRAFDHLPVLADALEDAGCASADILGHCRQGGEHVRGCWLVDALLGKT